MKKDVILAVLITFCLSVTLFSLVPSKSATGDYDPWADINDDGKINMYDIGYTARLFGTTGTAINKTELLLNLLDTVNSLNSTIGELQSRIQMLENKSSLLPAPAYDSGWIGVAPGQSILLTHNLNTTDVFVYMVGKFDDSASPYINQHDYGGIWLQGIGSRGAYWSDLDNSSIKVNRGGQDTDWNYIRLQMWKIPTVSFDFLNGLVGYWKFDEGTGTIAGDSSGNNNNGTLQNGPIWVDGKHGKALSFDGTDDYVEVPQSSSLDIVDSVSVTAWVYPTASPTLATILSRWYDGTESDRGIVLQLHDGSCFFAVIDDSNHLSATFFFEINKWYYIAATWKGLVSRIYVNGIEIGNRYTAGSFTNQNINLGIGSDLNPFHAQFNGSIDNLMIYNRALTADEIALHYLLPPP